MTYCKTKNTKMQPIRIAVFFITAALLSLSIIQGVLAAPTMQETVNAVKGFEATIRVEPTQPYTPAVGSKVEFMEAADGGRTMLSSGPVDATRKGEKLPTYDTGITVSRDKSYSTARGKVIMTRGDVITVRIDDKDWPAEVGDAVKVSFSVDGEVIPVGTWRISAVKEGGTVEALPFEIKGKPSVGLDAHVISREIPKVTKKTGKEDGHGATGKGWLGVKIRTLFPEERRSLNLSDTEGFLVVHVVPGGPADKGGLRPGDVFLEVDGRRVSTADDIVKIVSDGSPGKMIKIEFLREGERRFTRIKLEEKLRSEERL